VREGLIDLIPGQAVEGGDAPMVPGRWVLLGQAGAVAFNGFMAAHGDRVVPRKDRSWSVTANSSLALAGSFEPGLSPADVDVDALRSMNEVFESQLGKRATWMEWSRLSPLAPRLSDHLRPKPFDESIGEHLEFLEAVCGNPRSYLRLEEDMVPTGRARKLARKAITRLASHREDWERPTVLGVRPRRVLCVVPDAELDLYENRVAVQLVGHLRGYLHGRLDQLARIQRMLTQISDHAAGAARGHHWRRDRLYTLWSEAVTDDAAGEVAHRMMKKLESLLVRVLKLVDSPLYKAVPRGAVVSGLRYTNIFANDPVYRMVALLWKKWREEGLRRPVRESDVYEAHQQVASAMSWYAWLLAVRAADQLHLKPAAGSIDTAVDGEEIVLEGPAGGCSMVPPRDGAVVIRIGPKQLRVIGLAASLRGEDLVNARARLRALEEAAAKTNNESVLVLHLTPNRSTDALSEWRDVAERLQNAGSWELAVQRGSRLALLPVSPWDIGSVERVARFLRWHLHGPSLLAYPPRARCALSSLASGARWMVHAPEGDSWSVVRRPRPKEPSLEALLNAAAHDNQAKAAAVGGKAAKHAERDAERRTQLAREELVRAVEQLRMLEVCPICWDEHGEVAPLDPRSRSFRVACPSCTSVWGVYACGCGHSFPFIEAHSFESVLEQERSREPGWVDSALGADVLAMPCARAQGKPSYLCPECKRCACCRE